MSQSISPELIKFINTYIASIRQLEVLLFLFKNSGKEWNNKSVAEAVFSNEKATKKWLLAFHAQGLLTCNDSNLFRFVADSPFSEIVSRLEQEYKIRPLRVIEAITNQSTARMMSFMDAFKIKKETDDDNQ